jgi:hypothetical protein
MSRLGWLVLGLTLLPAHIPLAAQAQTDASRFIGTWRLVSIAGDSAT